MLKRAAYKAGLTIFLVLTGIILIYGIFYWSTDYQTYALMPVLKRGGLMMLAMAALIVGLFFIHTKLQKLSDRTLRYMTIGIFGLIVILQTVLLLQTKCLLRYDALKVYDEALSIFSDGGISPTAMNGYFGRYANNYGITIFSYIMLKIGRVLRLVDEEFRNGLLFLQFINLIAVDLSAWFGYLFVRCFRGKSHAVCCMILMLICPLTYVWLPFFYTNTISMPFAMYTLYTACKYFLGDKAQEIGERPEEKPFTFKNAVNYAELFFMGVCISVGMFIRATQIIPVIAIIICLWVFKKNKCKKETVIRAAIVLLGAVLALGAVKKVTGRYVGFDNSDSKFPTVHWIMMGMGPTGTYSMEDEVYTMGFATAEEKKQADTKLLKMRLKERGVVGTASHMMHKMLETFRDGTGNYAADLSIADEYSVLYRHIYGDYKQTMAFYCQVVWLSMLFLAMAGAVRLFRKKEFHLSFLFLLSLTGSYLFHMLWEAGDIYSIGFMMYVFVAAAGAFGDTEEEYVLEQNKGKNEKAETARRKNEAYVPLVFIIGAVIIVTKIWFDNFVIENRIRYEVNQYLFQADGYIDCPEDAVFVQTFKIKDRFNTVALQVSNPAGEWSDSIYEVRLTGTDGTIYDRQQIESWKAADYSFVELPMKSIPGVTDYRLEIQKVSGIVNLTFLYYNTGSYDAYKDGELSGTPLEGAADLSFRIYEVEK